MDLFPGLKNQKVLLVDDDKWIRHSLNTFYQGATFSSTNEVCDFSLCAGFSHLNTVQTFSKQLKTSHEMASVLTGIGRGKRNQLQTS